MKVHELMAKLAALNPEAEVYDGLGYPIERALAADKDKTGYVSSVLDHANYDRDATPSDTLIVLSE